MQCKQTPLTNKVDFKATGKIFPLKHHENHIYSFNVVLPSPQFSQYLTSMLF